VESHEPADRVHALPARERGVYLVVGGFGRVGYAHAEALARRAPARLVLAGRTELPERAGWDAHLAAHDEADPIARRIRQVRALEALGTEVLAVRADWSDPAQMRQLVATATSAFGDLHGVVVAAGAVDASLFRPIAEADPTAALAFLRQRTRGLYALEAALHDRPLDFVLIASSLASVLGGVGRAAYAAATSFMDAMAARCAHEGAPWLSVGWDAWSMDEQSALAGASASLFGELAIGADEGGRAVERALGLVGEGHVLVSTADLAARAEAALRAEPASAPGQHVAADAQAERAPRPDLHNPYVAPRDEMESVLSGLWESMLGLDRVGVHDNFFELGGNSLIGVKLIALVREKFGTTLPAASLYEGPTVESLARLLRAESEPERPAEEGPSRGARRRARRARQSASGSRDQDEQS
jgi:NAD(P)-dependent dehydrogenase (short-subunit alcohol dehydrogenase family)/acyl carrier protein